MAKQLKTKPSYAEAMMICVINSYRNPLDHSYTWRVEAVISSGGQVILSMSIAPMSSDFATISRSLGGVYIRKYWCNDDR